MFAGFARNFYLRAWLGTRVITAMVGVHGLIMTAWVLLFLTQTLLVAKQRVDLHRKLGVAGAVLAVTVLGLGIYTIVGSIKRQYPEASTGLMVNRFVAFDGMSLLLFAGLVMAALVNRGRPEIHKRLMLVAMISLLPPAFGRLVAYFSHHHVEVGVLVLMCATVLACILVDAMRHHRPHPAVVYGGMLVFASNALTYLAQIGTP